MKVKISLVQLEITQYEPEKNLSKAERYISNASSQGSDVVAFPELFITGALITKDDYETYSEKNGEYENQISEMAKSHEIDVCAGSVIEKDWNGRYNTSYYIDKKGRTLGKYRKINLWHPERRYVCPGSKICVFRTSYGKVGLSICWDLAFPSMFNKMAMRGAEIVFCPSFWCYGDAGIGTRWNKNAEPVMVDAFCSSRACENEMIIAYCNAAGEVKSGRWDDTLIGRTQVCAPFVGTVKKINNNREGMITVELNTKIIKDAERAYKIRKDLKEKE